MYENYAGVWSEIARRIPERAAIRSANIEYTYGELDTTAERIAGRLEERGIGPGSRIVFFLHNTAEFLVLFNACLKLEAIPVSVNYRYLGSELAELLAAADPVALVYGSAYWSAVDESLKQLAGSEGHPDLLIEVDSPGTRRSVGNRRSVCEADFEELAAPGPEDSTHVDRRSPSRDAELYIFTGGTTGTPKAVVWGIGDLLHIQQSSIYGPVNVEHPDGVEAAVRIATDESVPAVNTLPLAPFIHATALFSAMNTLILGGTVVINENPSLDPVEAAQLMVDERVTRLIVAGDAVAIPILDALEAKADGAASELSSVISSGMRFSDETKCRIHALGRVTIVDILASTEGGPYAMATTTRCAQLPARFRLTGDAVVLDAEHREVQGQPGTTGVLAYRGALPKGYLNDPVKTAETYPVINGVRHCSPGDYVRVEPHGFIELLGRGSSVVNTGGEKVFPGEVEEVLLEHPAVTDAVVFGVPDPRWGETVAAVVAVAPAQQVSDLELREHLAGRLAGYKKPGTLVMRDTLDRGPSGKLDLRRLKSTVVGESS